jgi:hypothetical protein
MTIPETLTGDFELGYELTHFWQNHRRFSMSRIDSQLRGDHVGFAGMSNCRPYRSVDDSEDPAKWYLPCGVFSRSVFSDEIVWTHSNIFSSVGIAYPSETESVFGNLSEEYTTGIRWLEDVFRDGMRNEHFIVWMRTSYLGTVTKIYSRCKDCTIEKGSYEILIESRYDEQLFGGEKHVTLTKSSPLGRNNRGLGSWYLGVGAVSLAFAIALVIGDFIKPRELGEDCKKSDT